MNITPYLLSNWALTIAPGATITPYTPPELVPQSLHGLVMGHPSFDDGESITTSAIVRTRLKIHQPVGKAAETHILVETKHSLYELVGPPDPKYEAAYPNARERIIKGVFK